MSKTANPKAEKVVLAYSGGLDTSVIIPWLTENYGYEVIAMCADVGQGDDLEFVKQKAIKTGASKVYVEDLREAFITEYIWPTLKAGAVYEGKYLLGTSMARPIIAQALARIARHDVHVALERRMVDRMNAHPHPCAVGRGHGKLGHEQRVLGLAADRRTVFAVQRDVEHAGAELLGHLGLQLQALAHARLDAAVVVAHRQQAGGGLGAKEDVTRMGHVG